MALGRRYPNARIVVLERRAIGQSKPAITAVSFTLAFTTSRGVSKLSSAVKVVARWWNFAAHMALPCCGKVIVATETAQLPLLENLYKRGLENNLKLTKLCAEEVKEIEPHVSVWGIQVFTTGIVNYKQVCQKMADLILSQEGSCLNTKVEKIARHLKLRCWKQTMAPLRLAL